MPKRVAMHSLVIQRTRDGKRTVAAENDPLVSMTAPIGEPFEFTKEEVEYFERVDPAGITSMSSVDLAASESPSAKAAREANEAADEAQRQAKVAAEKKAEDKAAAEAAKKPAPAGKSEF